MILEDLHARLEAAQLDSVVLTRNSMGIWECELDDRHGCEFGIGDGQTIAEAIEEALCGPDGLELHR